MEQKTIKPKAKDRDGLYKRRGYYHYELTINGKKRSFTTGTKEYNEAKRKRAIAIRELEQGKTPDNSGRKRFEVAADEYTKYREATVAAGTVRIDKERLPPLKRIIGNTMLRDITVRTIREYQATRAKQVSPRTVNLEVKLLRGILNSEGQWKRLAEDIRPLKESSETPGRSLTPEEALTLFETAEKKSEWIVAYLATLIANDIGMRGVEIRNLRLGDIDLFNKSVAINRSKTEAGRRTIMLTSDALKAVARLMNRATELGATEPEHFLIPARIKGGFDPNRPTKGWRPAWRSLRKAAGLEKFRFHDLRHTFITMHAEMGTPLPVLMEQAGHLSEKMTRLYTHISQRAMEKAAEKFEQVKEERMREVREKRDRSRVAASLAN